MWTDDEVRMLIDERKEVNGIIFKEGPERKTNKKRRKISCRVQRSVLEKIKIAIPTVTNTIATATVTNTTTATAAGSESAEDQDQKLQDQKLQRQQQQQQQDQEQEVVQIFEEEEGGSQSSLASLAIWEIDDD
ncbi:hypothetical protein RIR_jg30994.t1 [Rhizophagus irregularis DAOM 181602=DAOM 197198]|nr:hypothetical protein RIR_jg30994.t1 [Rhizophagus irregularis DAOM 181602=DAOM 197198]